MHFSWTWTEASVKEMDAAEVGMVLVQFNSVHGLIQNPIQIRTGNHF